MPLWVSFVLLAAGILAIYVEIFVPAAGLIGLAGGGMIVAAVVIGYAEHDVMTGTIVLFASLVITPLAVVIGLKAFPHTPVGKRLILGMPESSTTRQGRDSGRQGGAQAEPGDAGGAQGDGSATGVGGGRSDGDELESDSLLGREGTSLTVLRPSGMARIDGRKVSVLTAGEYIDRGARIRVTRAEGNRIFVREVKDDASTASAETRS